MVEQRMILTKEQVEVMDLKEVNRNLKQLAKTYQLDKPIKEILTPELWQHLDNIVDTLARLEDRKQWIEQYKRPTSEEVKE
jgi:predicted outer membrane protein